MTMPTPLEHPLTERVEEALRKAQAASRELRHEYVGTEHLLLGVISDPAGEIASLLRGHGIDPDAIPRLVAQTVNRGKDQDTLRIRPYTSAAKRALETAVAEATALNDRAVDLGHLMLALSLDNRAIAGQILTDVGVQTQWLRDHVSRRRGPAPPSAP